MALSWAARLRWACGIAGVFTFATGGAMLADDGPAGYMMAWGAAAVIVAVVSVVMDEGGED